MMPTNHLCKIRCQMPALCQNGAHFGVIHSHDFLLCLMQWNSFFNRNSQGLPKAIVKKLLKYNFPYIMHQTGQLQDIGRIPLFHIPFATLIQDVRANSHTNAVPSRNPRD